MKEQINNFGKKVIKNFAIPLFAVGLGITTDNALAQERNTMTKHKTIDAIERETLQEEIGQEKTVQVGKEVFVIKTIGIGSGWGKDRPSHELYHNGEKMGLYYGISSSEAEKGFFKIQRIYFDENDPSILVVEGLGEKHILVKKNGVSYRAEIKLEDKKIFFQKEGENQYKELRYEPKEVSEEKED